MSSEPAAGTAIVPYSHASQFSEKLRLPTRTFTLAGKEVVVRQAWKADSRGGSALGFGASVYPAAFVLAEWLCRHDDVVAGKVVVDVGAGIHALSSIAAGLAGCEAVYATDGDEGLLAGMQGNLDANLPAAFPAFARQLVWGDKAQLEALPPPDDRRVVIGSDIAALPYAEAFDPLVDTFVDLCGVHGVVYLSFQVRHHVESGFWGRLGAKFTVSEPFTDLHPDFNAPGAPDVRIVKLTPVAPP